MKILSLFMTLCLTVEGWCGLIDKEFCQKFMEAWRHKEEVTATQHQGAVSTEVWDEHEFTWDDTVLVEKQPGKDFTVLNLTDIHFTDFDKRALMGFEGEHTIRRLVRKVKPDLITLTGDLVCSDSTVLSIERLTRLMDSLQTPWAPVFGNHDDEGNCDLNYLAETMQQSQYCLLRKGDPDMGVGNYVIRVADPGGNTAEVLVMMDSHHDQANERQRTWYQWVAEGVHRLSPDAEISVLFHIPLPEYQYAYDTVWNNPLKQGVRFESVACERADGQPVQRGFFEILKNTGCKYIFCGHDHLNDFSLEYEGVRLTYMMKLGFASGSMFGMNGGTVIKIGDTGIRSITHKVKTLFSFLNILEIKP